MMDPNASALGLTGNFKQHAITNSKGKAFWDTFSETSSQGGAARTTPPPPAFGLARASSSGLGLEDISMGSPSASSNGGGSGSQTNPFVHPGTTANSSGHGTPQPHGIPSLPNNNNNNNHSINQTHPQLPNNNAGTAHGGPPSAAEISRRINSKRRRDDDLDPVSIKRRAVSPGMSVHNSPVMQSPLQRDMAPWGTNGGGGNNGNGLSSGSRPGSVGGDGRQQQQQHVGSGTGTGSGAPSESGSSVHGNTGAGGSGRGKGLGRVGFQGMVETNDGITRLSIE